MRAAAAGWIKRTTHRGVLEGHVAGLNLATWERGVARVASEVVAPPAMMNKSQPNDGQLAVARGAAPQRLKGAAGQDAGRETRPQSQASSHAPGEQNVERVAPADEERDEDGRRRLCLLQDVIDLARSRRRAPTEGGEALERCDGLGR